MKKNMIVSLLFVVFLTLAGCANMDSAVHKYSMKGQILDVDNNVAYLCIGSNDGAKVGQEYSIYKYEKIPNLPKFSVPKFKREEVGVVKIVEIVDEHYAKATVITGEAKIHYVVELK